ncbi:unnamed protein product [Prorocentrum cordatum]|uniref:Uncharacterized protein n=1 Tax=Prorocentrum cordatum TaxID=2364126 RepID=A0ABN9U3J7_9DINO|nr:unnamed protein product [Polarella glacialis]
MAPQRPKDVPCLGKSARRSTRPPRQDAIVQRAREKVGTEEGCAPLGGDSERFVAECYTAPAPPAHATASAVALAALSTGGAATGYAASMPYAISTATVGGGLRRRHGSARGCPLTSSRRG